MADITMCTNSGCPKAKDCYRRTANQTDTWQSWALFDYQILIGEVVCENYIPERRKHIYRG